MKETNVWLSPKELQYMLQGSLQWMDVAARVTTSKTEIRKLGETRKLKIETSVGEATPLEAEFVDPLPLGEGGVSRLDKIVQLEGQPVIWLLGSVGLLTLSSWFYYV